MYYSIQLNSFNLSKKFATGPSDFEPFSVEVTFDPSDTEKSINITVLEDDVLENREQFTVLLSPGVGVARQEIAAVIIEDSTPGVCVCVCVCVCGGGGGGGGGEKGEGGGDD